MASLGFSLRKAKIFDRRSSRVQSRRIGRLDGRAADRSSTDVVYRITKQVDPVFEKSLKIQEEAYFKSES